MKKNAKTYVLLTAVVFIWAVIIYKITAHTSTDDIIPMYSAEKTAPKQVEPDVDSLDMYELSLNYRDPFLGSMYKAKTTQAPVKKKSIKKEPKKVMKWPKLEYKGSVVSHSKTLCIIDYNNKQYLVSPGDSVEDLFIKKMYTDSLLLQLGKEEKTITKRNQ